MTFQMWSPLHFLIIASPFIFTLVFYLSFKGKGKRQLRTAGIVFSCISISLLIARNVSTFSVDHVITPDIIPLQVCHLANFVLLFAFILNNQILFVTALCFHLPAAFLSLVFSDSLTRYNTLYSWRGAAYVFCHMFIVGISLWAFSHNMIQLRLSTLFHALKIIIVLFVLSTPINNLFMKWMPGFQSNYFYTFVPEEGTPLQALFDIGHNITFVGITVNPIYIISLMITGLAVVFFTYWTFWKIFMIKKRVRLSKRLATKKPDKTMGANAW